MPPQRGGAAPVRRLAGRVFGGAALLLAAFGIYGLIAFGVAQRRREI